MSLSKRIKEAVAAGFSGIWLRSYEHEDAIRDIGAAFKEQAWVTILWDPERGITQATDDSTPAAKPEDKQIDGPITALNALRTYKTVKDQNVALVMRNVHPLLYDTCSGKVINPTLLQALQHAIENGKIDGRHVIILAYDSMPIPAELEKMVLVIDHDLPSPDELWEIMSSVVESETMLPKRHSPEMQLLLDAAAGLTRLEAEGAFGLSLSRHREIRPDTLWELKEGMLKKTGLLSMKKPKWGFSMLGGLNNMKQFCIQAIKSPNKCKQNRPRGILAIGLPGSGKSAFAEALGFEVGLPVVALDVGSLMGQYVGQTEERTRRALRTIDAMAPCILFIDELEKALAGAGGGSADSGVSDRMFGTFLTWLNDHESDVYTVGTANDIRRLMTISQGAFSRSGRFDATFFVDLPVEEGRKLIWDIWIKHYSTMMPEGKGLTEAQLADRPVDVDWTGADIRACVQQATLRGISLKDAAAQIVPVTLTAKEQIDSMRTWAHKRCLAADWMGIYDMNGPKKFLPEASLDGRPRRRVTRAAV